MSAFYYRVGTRVRIAECCCSRCHGKKAKAPHFLATGRIVKIDRSLGTRMPVIVLDRHRKTLLGCECWWTTERIHQDVAKKYGHVTS